MHNVRRYFREGQIYFLTLVMYRRRPILAKNVDLWWKAVETQQERCPFTIQAWVVLPDHLHVIVDPQEQTPASLVKRLKLSFSSLYLGRVGRRSGRVWHNRYWDHVIRDQTDMNHHIDYVHYNPVKHGYANAAAEYRLSSFQDYLQAGVYREDWAMREDFDIDEAFGE